MSMNLLTTYKRSIQKIITSRTKSDNNCNFCATKVFWPLKGVDNIESKPSGSTKKTSGFFRPALIKKKNGAFQLKSTALS